MRQARKRPSPAGGRGLSVGRAAGGRRHRRVGKPTRRPPSAPPRPTGPPDRVPGESAPPRRVAPPDDATHEARHSPEPARSRFRASSLPTWAADVGHVNSLGGDDNCPEEVNEARGEFERLPPAAAAMIIPIHAPCEIVRDAPTVIPSAAKDPSSPLRFAPENGRSFGVPQDDDGSRPTGPDKVTRPVYEVPRRISSPSREERQIIRGYLIHEPRKLVRDDLRVILKVLRRTLVLPVAGAGDEGPSLCAG